MIYAQIKDNIVRNIIVLENEEDAVLFGQGFDQIMRVDMLEPYPSIGWSYDGENFNPPIAENVG